MAAGIAKQQCQRIGCDAKFTDDENAEDSCRFHPGPPLFHDGGKEWSCCKQKSHDFGMFLELPGCQTGKHSSVKPQPKTAPILKKAPIPVADSCAAATCLRCKQGFFCSDHGSKFPTKVAPPSGKKELATPVTPATPVIPATVPKVVDLNAKQICKNKGCGKSYTEKENTATSCLYHPGPAVFHDRLRGWACCDIHVKDFDEFLEIPPCANGWHDANPEVLKNRAD